MDKNKGYIFLMEVAKNQYADEEERQAAVEVLADIGAEETLDTLTELYQNLGPVSLNFKRAVLHAIGQLVKRLEWVKREDTNGRN